MVYNWQNKQTFAIITVWSQNAINKPKFANSLRGSCQTTTFFANQSVSVMPNLYSFYTCPSTASTTHFN